VNLESTNLVYSPLEQFALSRIIPYSIGGFDISFTNSTLYMIVSVGLFLTYISFAIPLQSNKLLLIPSTMQSSIELLYLFVRDLLEEQVGDEGMPYFPVIFTIFTFILCLNLIGMIPYGFTATSHFIVTFGLSVPVFIAVTCIGFSRHGIHFLSFLLPPGAPLTLAPLLVVLELVSYNFRAISLGVRLFANMMAGHTLVTIIAGFGWSMFCAGGILAFASTIPMLIIFALTGLELGVAALQAYVFTILSCIYLNDAIALH
jgi:F-type H+-transporting ATPase subunit a